MMPDASDIDGDGSTDYVVVKGISRQMEMARRSMAGLLITDAAEVFSAKVRSVRVCIVGESLCDVVDEIGES